MLRDAYFNLIKFYRKKQQYKLKKKALYQELSKRPSLEYNKKKGTVFQSNAEAMKSRLNSISPTMCLAKWKQVNIHLTTGLTQSCYHPPAHKIPIEELKNNPTAIHNTLHKKHERLMMKNGERPPGCDYCWKIEDTPGEELSDRHYRSGETWASKQFENVVQADPMADTIPSNVEVNFNHACNLKCSYCSPHISSAWMQEIKEYGGYPTSTPHNGLEWIRERGLMPIKPSEENPYRDAFWKWWPELYKKLDVFRMTGGEPLMDPNTYKVLDYILQNPKDDLILGITSNFCVEKKLFDKFIEKIKPIANKSLVQQVTMYASVDTWDRSSEYIRNGLNFETFEKNIYDFLNDTRNSSICFINTFNCLSITNNRKMLEEILKLREQYSQSENRIRFDNPLLTNPAWQSISVLPSKYLTIMEDNIKFMKKNMISHHGSNLGFRDFEVNQMERNLNVMRNPVSANELKLNRSDFYKFFSEYDRRNGFKFLEYFPEMEDFWILCEADAKTT